MEDLGMVTKDDLWTYLGFAAKQKLPFFQEFTNPDAVIEPWTEEGERWLADQGSAREPLQPCWHQLVGVFRILQHSFKETPVLLMDGVGTSKMFQVISFIVCLTYYQVYYAKTGKFPRYFGM